MRVLSYNIHKGFGAGNRQFSVRAMRPAIHETHPDLVFLQEVVGQNDNHQRRHKDWPEVPQHDFFRSEGLQFSSYGRNVIYPEGHHGNAVISRFPFRFEQNVDVSVFKVEPRGFLHTTVEHPVHKEIEVHSLCVHLGLVEYERRVQAERIATYINDKIPPKAPLLVVGDFNDWRQRLSPFFLKKAGLKEAFLEFYGSHARSFPAWFPVSRLDRIYFRNLVLKNAERLVAKPWTRLSDHVPLMAEFEIMNHC